MRTPETSVAAKGGSDRGGGDLCKNEIDKHRREILRWIRSGDAAARKIAEEQGVTYRKILIADVSRSVLQKVPGVYPEVTIIPQSAILVRPRRSEDR